MAKGSPCYPLARFLDINCLFGQQMCSTKRPLAAPGWNLWLHLVLMLDIFCMKPKDAHPLFLAGKAPPILLSLVSMLFPRATDLRKWHACVLSKSYYLSTSVNTLRQLSELMPLYPCDHDNFPPFWSPVLSPGNRLSGRTEWLSEWLWVSVSVVSLSPSLPILRVLTRSYY